MKPITRQFSRLAKQLGHRDTRRAAFRILQPVKNHSFRRLLLFLGVAIMAWYTWNALTGGMPAEQRLVLFLFLIAVGLWATEAVPAFAVGLLIIGYLVFTLGTTVFLPEPWDVSGYVDTWSSPVIWLLLGGFFLADGLSRTGLDRQIFALAMRPAGSSPSRVLLAIMLTSAVASMFISNTSTTVLMIGAILPLVKQLGEDKPFSRALLISIPLAASVGGMGTIIGSAPNAIAVGVAADFGPDIDFIEWMVMGAPISIGLVLIAWKFISQRYPADMEAIELDLSSADEPALSKKRDRWIVGGISIVTVGLWMTTPLHGIHVAAISLIPIAGLTMTQVIDSSQVRKLPWDTLMLVAGGLSLGAAVVDTGLAERMASHLDFLSRLNLDALVLLMMAIITVLLSNVMSNTATVSVILPVAVVLLPGREIEMCVVLGLSASCALLLPVSTPPNAIAYSTGCIESRDLRPGGILIGLLGPAFIVVWVMLISWLLG